MFSVISSVLRLHRLSRPLSWGWDPGLAFSTTIHIYFYSLLVANFYTHQRLQSASFSSGHLNLFSELRTWLRNWGCLSSQQPFAVPRNGGSVPTTAFMTTVDPFADIHLWLLPAAKIWDWHHCCLEHLKVVLSPLFGFFSLGCHSKVVLALPSFEHPEWSSYLTPNSCTYGSWNHPGLILNLRAIPQMSD